LLMPEEPIESGLAGRWRAGSEQPSNSRKAEAFSRQNCLFSLLLAGLAEVIRARAVALHAQKRWEQAASTWTCLLRVLDDVRPGSAAAAALRSEVLSNQIKSMQEAALRPSTADVCSLVVPALRACHSVYGGGFPVWKLLFPQQLLQSLCPEWQNLISECWDKFLASSLQPGSTVHGRKDEQEELTPSSYEINDDNQQLTVLVTFPGLNSVTEAVLDVSDTEVHVAKLDGSQQLTIPLPRKVDTETCSAKFQKRTQVLRLTFKYP